MLTSNPETGISPVAFGHLSRLIRERCAIELPQGKQYFVEHRLAPLVERFGFGDIGGLVAAFGAGTDPAISTAVVDAVTVNESLFFRDGHPFETLRDSILPALISRSSGAGRPLTVWCGASSSGQEPVSLMLVIAEHFPELLDKGRLRIVATDLSEQMVERTREASYSLPEVQRGLPAYLLDKYFDQDAGRWRLRSDLRSHIVAHQVNLAGDWGRVPRSDLVLLRNVLIYFSADTKRAILERIHSEVITPDGCLMLGAAESTKDLVGLFDSELRSNRSVVLRPAHPD